MMTKLLIGLLGAGVIATGGYAAATSVDSDPARTVSLPGATNSATTNDDSTTGAATTDDRTTTGAEDVSGPCDEAEHANDPRCAGTVAPVAPAPATTTDADEDVSGPCDEAEHANDPRCTGGATATVDDDGADDRSGHGRGGDDDRDDHGGGDDDRSGSNSGKG